MNRDLAVLRRMLRIAERKRLITATPFREVEMLEERKALRANISETVLVLLINEQ